MREKIPYFSIVLTLGTPNIIGSLLFNILSSTFHANAYASFFVSFSIGYLLLAGFAKNEIKEIFGSSKMLTIKRIKITNELNLFKYILIIALIVFANSAYYYVNKNKFVLWDISPVYLILYILVHCCIGVYALELYWLGYVFNVMQKEFNDKFALIIISIIYGFIFSFSFSKIIIDEVIKSEDIFFSPLKFIFFFAMRYISGLIYLSHKNLYLNMIFHYFSYILYLCMQGFLYYILKQSL